MVAQSLLEHHISSMLHDIQVVGVVCNQWGDTGKGKFGDLLAFWSDVNARGTGGDNAGHTVIVGGRKRVFHLLPAGIEYDSQGKISVLGNGMVINPLVLVREIDEFLDGGGTVNNLMVSLDAHVIMPYHIRRDRNNSLGNGGIGSTGKGIGPCYADKVSYKGIMMRDLLDTKTLVAKLWKAQGNYPGQDIDIDDIVSTLGPLIERIRPYFRDTDKEMRQFLLSGKRIVLEGAQGLLLSSEFGTYPYVTSSDSSIFGTSLGVGLMPQDVDLTLGVVKFPFMTRVGAGPFPSEFGGMVSEEYCSKGLDHDIEFELTKYGIPYEGQGGNARYDMHHDNIVRLMNSADPFERGVGIRLAGFEFGATTGRPRRTGHIDLVALKHALRVNGPNVVLTKADVLQGAEEFSLCDGYQFPGSAESVKDVNFRDARRLYQATPHLRRFSGFNQEISNAESLSDLPDGLRAAIAYMSERTGAKVKMVSLGAERYDTMVI
jgi:adenylosuccinate synthase